MEPRFDIFTRLPDGRALWIQSCENLAEARERLEEVARNALGDCFIYWEEKGVVELVVRGEVKPQDCLARGSLRIAIRKRRQ
jgi:hypothetical protein